MKITKIYKIILFFKLLLLAFFLTNCANIKAPSGGPKDSIPPTVIGALPLDMTTKFDKKEIVIRFSEWPDRNKVVQNVSISPPVNMGYSWSGTRLNIEFLDTLKPNTTYSFMLGTEYTDLKGNKPDSAFAVTFSTGSIIDSGKIDGMLYGEKVPGTFIYAYKINNKQADTINPEQNPTEYKTQVGNNGSFTLRALPDGNYRIMAVKTEFKDNLFHPGSDFFGAPAGDIEVKEGSSKITKIYLTKYPNLQPNQIASTEQYANKIISINFTKPIKNVALKGNPNDFVQIYDSTASRKVEIKSIFLDSIISSRLYFILDDTLNTQHQYSFNALRDSVYSDTLGIFLSKESQKFNPKLNKNDFTFKISSVPFLRDSTKGLVMYDHPFLFTFNKPIKFDSSKKYFEFLRLTDKSQIPFEVKQPDPNSLEIVPQIELLSESWYRIQFFQSEIENELGEKLRDTVLKYDFLTADWRSYPKVSGKLLNKSNCAHLMLKLVSDDGRQVYETDSFNKGDWVLKKVRPGKYHLEVFCDKNGNNKYDCGTAFPFSFGEKFKNFSNVIEVKDRWDIENIMLIFEE